MSDYAIPRVYIADLAAYVEGTLVGRWFTPTDYDDADEFVQAVTEYITNLPHPAETGPREEWAIHDCDGFGQLKLGEYESLETVFDEATAINDHGPAYAVYVAGGYEGADFEEAYQGEWESEEDFARSLAEDLGAINEDAAWPYTCIDWEWATRELLMDYWSEPSGDGTVYVFRSI